MLKYNQHNAVYNINMQIDNKSFQNVVKLKYFGTAVTNKYCIQKEIKST